MQYGNNGRKDQPDRTEAGRNERNGLPVYKINDLVDHEIEVLGYEAKQGPYGRYLWAKIVDRTAKQKCWLMTGAKVPYRKIVSALTTEGKSRVGKVVYKDPYYDLEGMD